MVLLEGNPAGYTARQQLCVILPLVHHLPPLQCRASCPLLARQRLNSQLNWSACQFGLLWQHVALHGVH